MKTVDIISVKKQTINLLPKSVNYHKSELPSGLRIVSEYIPGVRSASLGIWVEVGSRHESALENGISHFIEHMAFKGTATRSALDIAKTIERGGGFINAFTGKELTCFYVHVLDEQLPLALELLSDILRNSLLDDDEIEKEKQVILDEIRDHEDMPDDLVYEHFLNELYKPHSLARPILGPSLNVKNFSRKDLLKFIDSHYTPNRMVVAFAGNINHKEILHLVKKKLDFSKPPKTAKLQKVSESKHSFSRHPRPIQQTHMVMGTRGLAYGAKQRFQLLVMNTVLGSGMSSRLFQNIREKHGIAYSIYSFSEAYIDTGFWGVYLATEPVKVDRGRELVLAELKQLRETLISKDEIDGVKTQLKGNIMLGLESVSGRMMRLAKMEIYLGKYVPIDEVSNLIESVTPRQIQTLASKMLTEDNMITTIVEPETKDKAKVKKIASNRATARPN